MPLRGHKLQPPAEHTLLATPKLGPAVWDEVVGALSLSPQQARIVELLLCGKRDKQIATALGLTVPTVRTYLARIFVRAGVQDRVELILRVFAIVLDRHTSGCHRDQ